jgi:uncharacterized protein YjbJ (UPF0337 family)
MPDMPSMPGMQNFNSGQMNQIKTEIQQTWSQVTNEDLSQVSNAQALVGKIQEKTGESGQDIQRKLTEIVRHAR